MKAKRIKVADDDAIMVRELEVRLRNLGFDTQASHNMKHALKLVCKDQLLWVGIDNFVPNSNGLIVNQVIESDCRFGCTLVNLSMDHLHLYAIDQCCELKAYLIFMSSSIWKKLKIIRGCIVECS